MHCNDWFDRAAGALNSAFATVRRAGMRHGRAPIMRPPAAPVNEKAPGGAGAPLGAALLQADLGRRARRGGRPGGRRRGGGRRPRGGEGPFVRRVKAARSAAGRPDATLAQQFARRFL